MRRWKGSPERALAGEGLEVDQLGLGLRDDGGHRARRQPLRVEPVLGHDELDQPARVLVVVDGEGRAVAEADRVRAEHAQAGRVEGGDPHPLGPGAHQLDDPPAHLVGRLVGEGDGQDLPGGRLARGEQVGDAPGEDAGLARTRAGHDEQRPAAVDDRLALGIVQALEQLLGPRAAARPVQLLPLGAARFVRTPGRTGRRLVGVVDRQAGRGGRRLVGDRRLVVVIVVGEPGRTGRRSKSVSSLPVSPVPGGTVTPTRWCRAAWRSRRGRRG